MAQPWQAIVLHPAGAYQSEVYAVTPAMQVGVSFDHVGSGLHGGFWRGSASTWTLLTDPGLESLAGGMDGASQVGYAGPHAALWHGVPGSWVDLDPGIPGTLGSGAGAVKGNIQVGGVAYPASVSHAGYWRGTASSFVDLNPSGANSSNATSTDGTLIGGSAAWTGLTAHAAIWTIATGAVVDINPTGASTSRLQGMAPGVQVGYARFPGGDAAALWHGTAASFVNLNPSGVTTARLYATTGRVHVGVLPQSSLTRAAVNFGSPDSWVVLQQFLPAQYGSFSQASAVFQDGPTIYIGGWARNSAQYDEAILWIGNDPCYPNCDSSTTPPVLNVLDFGCFLNKFASGDGYANCDGSTTPPILNILDFGCFLNRFAAGCS